MQPSPQRSQPYNRPFHVFFWCLSTAVVALTLASLLSCAKSADESKHAVSAVAPTAVMQEIEAREEGGEEEEKEPQPVALDEIGAAPAEPAAAAFKSRAVARRRRVPAKERASNTVMRDIINPQPAGRASGLGLVGNGNGGGGVAGSFAKPTKKIGVSAKKPARNARKLEKKRKRSGRKARHFDDAEADSTAAFAPRGDGGRQRDGIETDKARRDTAQRGTAQPDGKNVSPSDDDDVQLQRPTSFLPRMCYFENTYLGGNAAYRERLRRLSKTLAGADQAWMQARAAVAEVDPPSHAAMGLSATLDRRSLRGPGRVWLQVGLRGSRRYGWRRPPLDVAVVVTREALSGGAETLTHDTLRQLARRLGPQDRIEVRVVGKAGGVVVQQAVPAPELRHRVASLLERVDTAGRSDGLPTGRHHRGGRSVGGRNVGGRTRGQMLSGSLAAAGEALVALSDNPHRVPGTRLVLLIAGVGDARTARAAERAAHGLQLRGAVTSVLSVGESADANQSSEWWRVANAGHGNFHRVAERGAELVVQSELDTLSRVVARLLRINIRLGRHANAVRILGSKVLRQREVARVKAREKRIDAALSSSMGVAADRGDDDDGIQTVIPYFYGDDSHVLLIELWVEKPGVIADITLRYKDLVNLNNATERVSVTLSPIPRQPTPAQREVHRNVEATQLALSLGDAWRAADGHSNTAALPALRRAERAAKSVADRRMVRGLQQLILDNRTSSTNKQRAVRDALRMARDRKVGDAGR